mmetsp:Transcript_14100/g.16352  ORF Transcript_14100/g.16352 Transcript_14100/m.16352 type:complete len:97 (+) Transcript_14100:27-317(+)
MSEEIDNILNDEAKLQEVVDFCFKDADADGNGTIDKSEFERHLQMVYEDIGIPIPDTEALQALMENLDMDKNGTLDKNEFKAYVVDMLKKDKANRS